MVKKKRSLKDIFESFPTRVTLGATHDVGWRWKGPRRKKLEAEHRRVWGRQPFPLAEMHCVSIPWSEKGRGFGEYFFFKKDGVVYCGNECDSRETVKRILCTLVDQSVFIDEVYQKTGKKIAYWPPYMTKKSKKK